MTTYSVHAGGRILPLPPTLETSATRLPHHRIIGSPFDANPTPTTPICRPSSDCGGSSSGLGGMTKTDIISSDESSLASDAPTGGKTGWPVAHPVLLNNGLPPVYMSCNTVPTSSTSPTPTYADHGRTTMVPNVTQRVPPPIANNDLFVHIQTGETLSILVGNDVQHIAGPATVRMVNQAGMSPSALPLHVPPGHMVQQIVDEQGILRHLILSPESAPASRMNAGAVPPPPTINPNTPIRGSDATAPLKPVVHGSPSPPIVPPYPPPNVPFVAHNNNDFNEESIRKNWMPHAKKASQLNGAHLIHVPYSPADDHEQSQSGASANEEEEWERLSEMLSRMQPPQILRVAAKEADISWQELDTSEASAPGGPFPQIDASEFTYEIVLFESVHNGRIVSSYRCEPDSGNRVRLCRLRPNTDYYVHLKASLEERGLQGSPSPAVKFRTLCTVPECPQPPRFIARTQSSLTVGWRPAIDNGSPITLYRIEIAQERNGEESEHYEVVYEGLAEQTKIKGLSPSTRYRVRVVACNSEGESQPSAAIGMNTSSMHPPKQPQRPQLASLSSRAVKLSWSDLPEHSYTLEMSDTGLPTEFTSVCERAQQSSANITDLSSNRVYHFRLVAHNDAGDSEPSEALIVRTPPSPSSPTTPPATPAKPHVIANGSSRLEIGWSKMRTSERDNIGFVVEGSCDEQNWSVLYKGSATSALVRDPDLSAFRVSALRKQVQSAWSEILRVKRESKQTLTVPGRCAAPSITETSKGCLRVQWSAPEGSTSPILYQLHRVNLQPSTIVYQGEATMFDLSNCAPGEEIEVQVRAIAVGTNGERAEGEWSRVAVGRTAPQPPSPPLDVRLDSDNTLHWSPPANINGAPITEYILERTVIPSSASVASMRRDGAEDADTADSGWRTRRKNSNAREEFVGEGTPGCRYQLSVSAVNAGGTSLPSECVYVSIPPAVPSPPSSFSAVPQGCRQLRASWRAAICNGSEISEYVVRVFDEATCEEERVMRIAAQLLDCTIEALEPDHAYKLSVSAVNGVGIGAPSWCTVSTLAPPPPPPQLLCSEAGPSYLKLKWKPSGNSTSSSSLYYYLEKENDSGKFSPIYEGDNRYAKVRNLSESTKYRFRVRCSSRVSGMGPWSAPFEFTTEQLPPPTIRSAPSVTEVAAGCFQVEWSPLRSVSPSAKEPIFYRLQLAPRTSSSKSSGYWKTIYEGVSTSYSLSSVESVQLRVQCVRVRDGNESVSAPSAVQFATPSLVTPSRTRYSLDNEHRPSVSESDTSTDTSNVHWIQYHLFSDKHYAIVILAFFVVLAFMVALLLDAFVLEHS
uniref:Fibronectin type III domain-containing protein 3B n=1 Tax=Ascaris suum TaxID=6253 RepID=F1KRI8_ASCSU